MAKLVVTTDQKADLITLESKLESAFADGVEDTGLVPLYDPMPLYSTPEVQAVKDEVKAPFKSLIAAMLVAFNIKRALPTGISTTVPLAKLTNDGSTGSLTFVDGILTAKVDPT
jgi:hypothetical protein